ncbi:MAG: response regulator [Candidatus Eremiobacterota bacterium]
MGVPEKPGTAMRDLVLVIEDEPDLKQILRYNLEQAGYGVLETGLGNDGMRLVNERRPHLVLLDLMLPDVSGLEVCRRLKADAETRGIPILMLTARGEESDRIRGFELGAEDYVVKPFSLPELLLRIQALLRRLHGSDDQPAAEHGCLKIDFAAHRAWVHGHEVELTALEFRLLSLLWQRRNRVQSREALLDSVWGVQAAITSRTVDTHVKRLREKLGSASAYVETVRGFGYRFSTS